MSGPNLIYPPPTGGGGGGVSGSGTPNFLPIWSTATSLSDSPLSFSGSTLTYSSALTTHAFAVPQSWTLPANTQAWRINGQQLVFDGGSGYLGINPPTSPAAPLHVEGSVGTSELVRLRNTSTALASPVGIQAHAANRGSSTPTGKIENYPIAFSPLYGVYDWVYSLPTPSNVMTEVFRQTAPTTILTVTLTSGGSGYTTGTYSQVLLTNVSSSGSGATADINVASSGSVAAVVIRNGGDTYQVGDTLTCASIGGGTGFVLTVASVGSRATTSGNVTAARIGAGTTAPLASMHAAGAFLSTATERIAFTTFLGNTSLFETSSAKRATVTLVANTPVSTHAGDLVVAGFDASAATAATSSIGYFAQVFNEATSAAVNHGLTGVLGQALRSKAADLCTGGSFTGVNGVAQVSTGVGSATSAAFTGGSFTAGVSATGHTVTTTRSVLASASMTNGTSTTHIGVDVSGTVGTSATVGTWYGLRLQAPSVSGTITNRWGISQEDAAAKNYFAGIVGIGTTPNAWATSVRATEMRTHALWNYNSGSDSVAYWTVNAYLNSGGTPTYKASTFASQYTQIGGAHVWERAVSGTAGNAVTWLESARIDSSGNVGIGTANPLGPLDTRDATGGVGIATIYTGAITANVGGKISFGGYFTGVAPTTWASIVGGKDNNTDGNFAGHLQFLTRPSGGSQTERARIDSSGNLILNSANTGATIQAAGTSQGLKLPATPGNTDPNTLDCYADGGTANSGGVTWTPVLKFGGNTTGITYTFQIGRYTRIGNMVFAQCHINLSSKGTATGVMTIDGLPQSANVANMYGANGAYTGNVTFGGYLSVVVYPNTTSVALWQSTSGAPAAQLTDANFANNSIVIFTVSYPVT